MRIKSILKILTVTIMCLITTVKVQATKIDWDLKESDLPSRYDLRELNRVTPVRNQGVLGTCNLFAAFASLESTLMKYGEWDFSESHFINNHGFDNDNTENVADNDIVAYLLSGNGFVLEEDEPYYTESSPQGLKGENLRLKNYFGTRIYGVNNMDKSFKRAIMKKTIMDYGGVSSALRMGNYFGEGWSYNVTSYNGFMHAVTVVGWDDSFSKELFLETPQDDGAWIVKNSYGENWGDNGYFYISYYTLGLGDGLVYEAEPINYDRMYSYDPLGYTDSILIKNDYVYYTNVFEIGNRDEYVNEINIYLDEEVDYEIYVVTDFKDESDFDKMKLVTSGQSGFTGQYTLDFPSQRVKANSKFAVIVKEYAKLLPEPWTPHSSVGVPLESPQGNSSSKATAEKGQSYYSVKGINWIDTTDEVPNSNVSLKAYTTFEPVDIVDVEDVEISKSNITLNLNEQYKLTTKVYPSDATNSEVTWISEDEGIASVDSNGNVTANNIGVTYIVVTTEDGNYEDICKVTVLSIENNLYDKYEIWDKTLVNKNPKHSWIISLNKNIDIESVNSSSVYILDVNDNKLNFINLEVLNSTLGSIKLNNLGEFETYQDYWIIIEDTVKSIDNVNLEKGTKARFRIEN